MAWNAVPVVSAPARRTRRTSARMYSMSRGLSSSVLASRKVCRRSRRFMGFPSSMWLMRWLIRRSRKRIRTPIPVSSVGVATKYFFRNVVLIQLVNGWSRARSPNAGRPSWKPWMRPPTSCPCSMKPNGAPNPISLIMSYAMYLRCFLLGKGGYFRR